MSPIVLAPVVLLSSPSAVFVIIHGTALGFVRTIGSTKGLEFYVNLGMVLNKPGKAVRLKVWSILTILRRHPAGITVENLVGYGCHGGYLMGNQ